jgi:hypothetical protein
MSFGHVLTSASFLLPPSLGSHVDLTAVDAASEGGIATDIRHFSLVNQFALLDEPFGCSLDKVRQGAIVALRPFAKEFIDVVAQSQGHGLGHNAPVFY